MANAILFKNSAGSVNVVRKGKTFPFNSGRFWTTNKEDEKLLKAIADAGEQGVWIDPAEPEIDPTAATPMEILRRKIIREWQEQQGIVADHGTYGAGVNPLGVTSTADSVLMGNSLAGKVAQAREAGDVLGAAKTSDDKAAENSGAPVTPAPASNALSALNALKGGAK